MPFPLLGGENRLIIKSSFLKNSWGQCQQRSGTRFSTLSKLVNGSACRLPWNVYRNRCDPQAQDAHPLFCDVFSLLLYLIPSLSISIDAGKGL